MKFNAQKFGTTGTHILLLVGITRICLSDRLKVRLICKFTNFLLVIVNIHFILNKSRSKMTTGL
jgi:hypothetical protein